MHQERESNLATQDNATTNRDKDAEARDLEKATQVYELLQNFKSLPPTERGLVLDYSSRMLVGFEEYGPFDREKITDRDWVREQLEELQDGDVYHQRLLAALREQK